MGAADRETTANQLFRERRARTFQPSIRMRRHARGRRGYSGHGGGEGQRAGQLVFFGADRANAFKAPCAGGLIAEKTHCIACAAKRRLVGFQRLVGYREAENVELARLPEHSRNRIPVNGRPPICPAWPVPSTSRGKRNNFR